MLIWSPVAAQMVPMKQVVTQVKTEFEDAHIVRRNRTRMLRIHCDPKKGFASELFARIKPRIEKELEQILKSIAWQSQGHT